MVAWDELWEISVPLRKGQPIISYGGRGVWWEGKGWIALPQGTETWDLSTLTGGTVGREGLASSSPGYGGLWPQHSDGGYDGKGRAE